MRGIAADSNFSCGGDGGWWYLVDYDGVVWAVCVKYHVVCFLSHLYFHFEKPCGGNLHIVNENLSKRRKVCPPIFSLFRVNTAKKVASQKQFCNRPDVKKIF